jgi:hypothetical protein
MVISVTCARVNGPDEMDGTLLDDCGREPVNSGIRTILPADRAPALTELVLAEQSCCGLLNFSLTFDGRTISLTVTGPEQAQLLIAQLAGCNRDRRQIDHAVRRCRIL